MCVSVIVEACICDVQGLQVPAQPANSSSLQPPAAAPAPTQPVQSVAEPEMTAAVSHWSAVTSSAQPAFNKVY